MKGMNKKQLQNMMKQMGVEQQDIPADQVIIKSGDKEVVFDDPSVAKVDMMGQETWQVTGDGYIRELDQSVEISDEDIKTVVDQTGVSEDNARDAIEDADGDLAEAIMNLQG
jgi:nascent polypeptide-associated complex subunit alpha